MPPRIGHQKSRSGCRLCKARKVKCDERRPSCTWCLGREVPCSYDHPAATAIPTWKRLDPGTASDASRSYKSYGSIEGRNISPSSHSEVLALKTGGLASLFLLHHFTSVVTRTFPSEQISETHQLYTKDMMQTAFEHEFLMDAILSVSANHVELSGSPVQRYRLPELALPSTLRHVDFAHLHGVYLDRAVRGQRDALSKISPDNAQAVFFSSIMLCISSIRSLRPVAGPSQEYLHSLPWLTMSNAVATVAYEALAKLPSNSVIEHLVSVDSIDYRSRRDQLYDPINTRSFQALLDFKDGADVENTEECNACQAALALIGGIYDATLLGERAPSICRRLMAFGPLAPQLFLTMLNQKRPRSLTILAHYMAMTKMADCESYWWFYGMAEREVTGLWHIIPPQWQWAMEWPMMVVQQRWGPENWTFAPATRCPST